MCERPVGLDERDLSVAAALAELHLEPIFLDPGLAEMPRTLARAKVEAPEPLRKRARALGELLLQALGVRVLPGLGKIVELHGHQSG